MTTNVEHLKDSYFQWLRQKTVLRNLDGAVEITTPMVDRYNDYLQIYVVPKNGKFKLTDDGYIINELVLSGCDVFSSEKRKNILETILNGHGVKRKDSELFVETTEKTFPQKKHSLLQAMLSINDMFMVTQENVTSMFLEDVEDFLTINNIRFTENVAFVGKSGFNHHFDFVIPHFKKQPERIIKAINNPTRNNSESLLFAWDDTIDTRKSNTILYAFLNDSNQSVNNNVLAALEEYNVTPVRWSQRSEYIKVLSA